MKKQNERLSSPILVKTMKHIAEGYVSNCNAAKAAVQSVIDLYNATCLPALTGDELQGLFGNTEKFLYGKLTGGRAAHLTMGQGEGAGQVAVNEKSAMEMIAKPAGYEALLTGIADCIGVCLTGWGAGMHYGLKIALTTQTGQYFTIDSTGAVVFTPDQLNKMQLAGNVYANTERGAAMNVFLKKVQEAFKESGLDGYMGRRVVKADTIADLFRDHVKEIDLEAHTVSPAFSMQGTTGSILADTQEVR